MKGALCQEYPIKVISGTKRARERLTILRECKICQGPAQYSHYGAVVCNACKIFFRRNALIVQTVLKSQLHSQCDIQYPDGQKCSSCRLKKCFANGMSTQLIRCAHSTKNKKRRTLAPIAGVPVSSKKSRTRQSIQTPTSNLLQSDQSLLNSDQWTLLSNLVHCFDKYSKYSFIEQYLQNQNALPPKLRYKCSSVKDFIIATNSNAQVVCEKTRDALFFLSPEDRTTLRRTTVKHTSGIIALLMASECQLYDDLLYYKSAELILQPTALALYKRAIEQLDPDSTFVKVIIAALAFSTTNYTSYDEFSSCNSMDVKSILLMQDTYTELAWRYLSYKYGHQQAVLRISNLLRCLLLVNEAVVEAHKSVQFIDIMDSVLKQTEQKLRL